MAKPREQIEQENFEKHRRAQMDFMRDQVQEVELQARYWKAQWESKYYTLEDSKLKPEYDAYFLEVQKAANAAAEELKKTVEDQKTELSISSLTSDEYKNHQD